MTCVAVMSFSSVDRDVGNWYDAVSNFGLLDAIWPRRYTRRGREICRKTLLNY